MAYLFLLVYISAIFIRPHEWSGIGADTPIIKLSVILTFFAYLFTQKDKKLSPQFYYLSAVGIVVVLSTVFNGWPGGVFFMLMQYLPAVLLPFIVTSGILDTANKQKGIMLICIIATLFMVHNGYTQHHSWDGSGWAVGTYLVEKIRITYVGIFQDPNDIAMFFVMTIPFTVYFIFNSNFIIKILSIGALCALVYGVVLTNSRGGLLGLFALSGVFFVYKYGVRKAIFAAIGAVPVLIVVMSMFRKIEQGESANGRVEAWYAGMYEMFLHNPLLGVSKGAFTDYHTHTAHNSFILVIGELGFLGYLFWLAALVTSIVMVARPMLWYRKQSGKTKKKLPNKVKTEIMMNVALFFSFVGFLTTCFFLSRSYIILLFVFMGMAVATYYRTIKVLPELKIKDFNPYFKKIAMLTVGSIIFFFILVRVLL